jgi:hypothetical protein
MPVELPGKEICGGRKFTGIVSPIGYHLHPGTSVPAVTTIKKSGTHPYWQPSSGFRLLLPRCLIFFTPALFDCGAP